MCYVVLTHTCMHRYVLLCVCAEVREGILGSLYYSPSYYSEAGSLLEPEAHGFFFFFG